METEARGDGESRGAEGEKEIGLSGVRCCSRFGRGFNTGPKEKRPFDGAGSSENGERAKKQTRWESEAKT
jgi:hypothetical protein